MSQRWFTSDTHFGHLNVINFCNRPFKDLDEMHHSIIEDWNSKVAPGDIVYHLGDFSCCSSSKAKQDVLLEILQQLNGNKWLIIGNHDSETVIKSKLWVKALPYHEIRLPEIPGLSTDVKVVLFHYPIRSWNQQARGAWMLHGHCHNLLPDPGGKIIDVGYDAQGGLISVPEIQKFMETRPIVTSGDHPARK